MSRRSRRRIATQAALSNATAELDALRARSDAQLSGLRDAYDTALADAGTVLFSEVAEGSDTYHVSASARSVLGWEPGVFLSPGVLRAMVHPDDLTRFDRAVRPSDDPAGELADEPTETVDRVIDLTAGATTIEGIRGPAVPPPSDAEPVVRFRSAHGTWRSLAVRVADSTRTQHPFLRAGAVVDVTSSEAARTTTRRFAEMMELDPSGCLVLEFTDPADPASLVIRAANRSAHRMFNLERPDVDGATLESVLGPSSAQLIRSALFDVSHTGESMTAERISLTEVRGTYLDLRVDRLGDGTLGMTVTDVTATAALEERLRHQASHDALTALPNRSLLEERLAVAVAAASPDAPLSLSVIDIDGLAAINDSLGLHLGDHLLIELGRRLVREVRGTSVVSRIGGDEFAVLSLPCSSEAEALERARSVHAALQRPFDIAGHVVSCSASIGVALAPTDGDDGRSLLRAAHRALEQAKADGSGFARHRRDESAGSIHRLALLAELRRGLANHELELHFQPLVDLRSGRVTKVEALLGWQRDGVGRLPMEFLELAEQSGLIQPLTRWVLAEAARAARTLRADGHDVTVSTNLSMRNLADPDLLAFIGVLVGSGELDTSTVEIEVGEVDLMDDPVRAQETLGRLRELGLRFVVDDFGTGYTSLSTMQLLDVSGLKIDRTFISTMSDVTADAAVVRSTIELCHELGLTVTAEGVGDAETLSLLSSFGCDLGQGAHLSEAVTLEGLPARVRELELALSGWTAAAS